MEPIQFAHTFTKFPRLQGPDSFVGLGTVLQSKVSYFECVNRKNMLQYLTKKHGKQLVRNGQDYHLFSDKPMSKLKWLIMLRGKISVNFAARFMLKSKTWSDHLLMSRINYL